MRVNCLAFFSFYDVCQVFISERNSISRGQSKSNSELWSIAYSVMCKTKSMIVPPTSVEAESFF